VVQIQEYEGRWLVPLLEQAQRNLGSRGQIETIVIDRGYLDGADLWQVHQQGVTFVVTSKAGMSVTADAQALAKGERVKVREQVVRHGHGKGATEERLRTELVGIEALTSYDAYGDPEQTQYAHRRDYTGQPINAVVVRRWNNRVPKGEGTVYLTNGPVSDPFAVFDRYDCRSVIENGIFKEGKYPWHLGRFPKKTEAAVIVHVHFTEAFDGALDRLSLLAGPTGLGLDPAAGEGCQPEYDVAGRRRDGRLSTTTQRGKS
jgi:Transposase DDE domain